MCSRSRNALAESDLYRVLVGLMDGASSGTGIASDLHFNREFGFGYLAAFYAFVDPATLRDPDRLMALINQVGFWSMLAALAFFWCAVQLIHGSRVATIALVVFALGPMVPELATSGHQTIPMLAFLFAGASLLMLPVTGWKAVLAAFAGGVLLLIGMTVRGELFLALPWIVLARVDARSWRAFLKSAILRSIAPALALVSFIVLQHYVESSITTTISSGVTTYFVKAYAWSLVIPGVFYLVTGSGIVTVVLAAIAAVAIAWSSQRRAEAPASPDGRTFSPRSR